MTKRLSALILLALPVIAQKTPLPPNMGVSARARSFQSSAILHGRIRQPIANTIRSKYPFQLATISGMNGLGWSTFVCKDRDGDRYGVGVNALFQTSSASGVSAGTQTITPGSMTTTFTGDVTNGSPNITNVNVVNFSYQVGETLSASGFAGGTIISSLPPRTPFGSETGTIVASNNWTGSTTTGVTFTLGIGVGTVLELDTAPNIEKTIVSAVTPTTFTVPLLIAHSAGFLIGDEGCFGRDADDNDVTVHSASDALTKWAGSSTVNNANLKKYYQHLGYAATGHLYYIDLTTGVDTGSPPACQDNPAAPCQNYAYIRSQLIADDGSNLDDVIVFRGGLQSRIDLIGATSSAHPRIIAAYPGEAPELSGASDVVNAVSQSNWKIDGLRISAASDIDGGTPRGAGSAQASNVELTNIELIDNPNQFDAPEECFNGCINWNIHDFVAHDGTIGHGVYNGSSELVSGPFSVHTGIVYNEADVGVQWNARANGYTVSQMLIYNTDQTCINDELGPSNAVISSNICINPGSASIQLNEYDGNAASSICGPGFPSGSLPCCPIGSAQNIGGICPYDITGTVIENNTSITSGVSGYSGSSTGSNPNGIILAHSGVCSTAQCLATSLDGTIFRNNITVTYVVGSALQVPFGFFDHDTGSAGCVSGPGKCQDWFATATFSNNVGFYADGSGSQTMFWAATGYTCSSAASVTTITGLCTVADPKFINYNHSLWSTPFQLDLRIGVSSPALHAGTLTGIPNYDLAGRAFLDDEPAIGALERNPFPNQGWNNWNGAGPTAAVAPANGAPLDTLTSGVNSSTTSIPVVSGANAFPGVIMGVDSELMCILNGGTTTITVGLHLGCTTYISVASVSGFTGPYIKGNTSGATAVVFGVDAVGSRLLVSAGIGSTYWQVGETITQGATRGGSSGVTTTITAVPTSGRGWAGSSTGTTAATHSSGATVYYNTISASGAQGTSPATYYPFQTQWSAANGIGAGLAGTARDIPGKPKQLLAWGGGHSDYGGSEVYALYPNRATPLSNGFYVQMLSNTSVIAIPGFDGYATYNWSTNAGLAITAAMNDDQSPSSSHAVNAMAYAPWIDKVVKFGGGYFGGNGLHQYDTNTLDPNTGKWTRFSGANGGVDTDCGQYGTLTNSTCGTYSNIGRQYDPTTASGSGFSSLAIADPTTQSIWPYWQAGGFSWVTQYFPAFNDHIMRANTLPALQCCGTFADSSAAGFVADRRWIFYSGLSGASQGNSATVSGTSVTLNVGSVDSSVKGIWINNGLNAVCGWTDSTHLTLCSSGASSGSWSASTPATLLTYVMDISSSTATAPGPSPNPAPTTVSVDSSCYPALSAQYTGLVSVSPGLTWNTALHKMFIYPGNTGGNQYFLMDPANWTCTTASPSSGPAANTSTNAAMSGLAQYFPSIDATAVVANWTGGANGPKILSLNPPDPTGTVVCTITLSPSSPGPYTNGQTISTITANANNCGTVGSLSWSSSGAPTGLTNGCNGASGTATCTLTGTVSTAGTFSTSISVTDGGSNSASINPSIVVNAAPSITSPTSSLPNGTQGSLYNSPSGVPIAFTGGTAPVVCSLSSGTLPSGLSVSSACGTGLTGTPTASGTFTNIRLTATDANSITSTVGPFTLTINANIGPQPTVGGPGMQGLGIRHIPFKDNQR